MNNSNAEGRVVVVTGAAGRLAERLIQALHEQGARVAAVVRREAELQRVLDTGAEEALVGDLSDEVSARGCFSTVCSRLGRPHGLIHAAGGWQATPLLESPLSDWHAQLKANLISTVVAFREAAGVMSAGGRLIAFTSGQGADRATAGQGAYSAAKAGVIRLVESAAAELRPNGISTFAIAPSTILFEQGEHQKGVAADALVELCLFLLWTEEPDAYSGQTFRAYGSG